MFFDIVILSISIFILLILSAFFSGSETALTASTRSRLTGLNIKGKKNAQIAINLLNDKESLIGAILLGNNLVNILASSLATSLLIKMFGDSGVAYAVLIMTVLIVIFAEYCRKVMRFQILKNGINNKSSNKTLCLLSFSNNLVDGKNSSWNIGYFWNELHKK